MGSDTTYASNFHRLVRLRPLGPNGDANGKSSDASSLVRPLWHGHHWFFGSLRDLPRDHGTDIGLVGSVGKTGGSKLNHAVLVLMMTDEKNGEDLIEFDRICWTWFRTMVHQISWAIQTYSRHVKASTDQQPITDYLTFPSCFVVPPLGSRRESWQCPTMETWSWMMQRFWC